jgi:4-amino-4-deoxy-L-arabinose transferase-like glycosyltransferase
VRDPLRLGKRTSMLAPLLPVAALAALLRLVPFAAGYPLHHDEALYGYWARLVASGSDPFLLQPWIDKPPLAIYLMAASVRAAGPTEAALRLPGMVAGILLVPSVWGLAQMAFGRKTAVVAALLTALSPMAILFAPTAFTDGLLTLFLVWAAWAAVSGKPLLAGLALGLAVATKQQGVLGVPLVALLLLSDAGQEARTWRWLVRSGAACLLGFGLVFGPLAWWDSLRWHNRPSFWDRSLTTYSPLALVTPGAIPERLTRWGEPLRYLFGPPIATAAAAFCAAYAASLAGRPAQRGASREARITISLVAWCVAYLLLHFLVTFQPWDRYLLPLVPFGALLAARGIDLAWKRFATSRARRAGALTAAAALTASLLFGAWLGAAGQVPLGSDHSAHAGLEQLVERLRAAPADAVIYDRWLGWHYDFYLYGLPQERRWWGTAWKLADEAARTAGAQPDREQLLAFPGWEADERPEADLALAARGLRLAEVMRVAYPDGRPAFLLYRIRPLGPEAATPSP